MNKELYVERNYLLIPIATGKEYKTISFLAGEDKFYEFRIPMMNEGDSDYQYKAPLPVTSYLGTNIRMVGDYTEVFLQEVTQADQIPTYEEQRPRIHFSANTGWINDPNGLIYDKGLYHLYFQYNPFDIRWENMCWGHAISEDMLHWQQKETVLYPDQEGLIYSGSGIINEQGLLGIPKDAYVYFYTCAGDRSDWSKGALTTQKIAYSMDGGDTLHIREGAIVPHICGENRDPKVYWHELSKAYFMVLYLEENDFSLFRSTDLQQWSMTQRFTLEKAWECPDLREIPVIGGGSRWMFWSADGYYYLGDFDGYEFKTDGIRREAYKTTLPYAAQTFWGINDRVVTIPWIRSLNKNKLYTGIMGIPRELRLIKTDTDYVLSQVPIREFEEQKVLKQSTNLQDETIIYHQEEKAVIEIKVNTKAIKSMEGTVFHIPFNIQTQSGAIAIAGQEGMLGESIDDLSIIIDGEIIEITANQGTIYAVYEAETDDQSGEISITVEDSGAVEIYQIH